MRRCWPSTFPRLAETQPELLAHHYTEAGLTEQAVPYWQRAGQRAAGRSAHVEAISHLTKGLEVLSAPPGHARACPARTDAAARPGGVVDGHQGLCGPGSGARLHPGAGVVPAGGRHPQLFPVLWGLWGFYHVRGELQTARELGEQLLSLAQRQHDPALLLQAHRALGDTLFWLGEFVPARAHLEQGMALYDPQQHRAHALLYGQDPGMGCRVYAALVLWVLGYPDQALQRSQEALTLARSCRTPLAWRLP